MASKRRFLSGGLLTVVLLAATAGRGESWGGVAHRMAQRKAVTTLPPELRRLFEANLDYLAEHSIDPDLGPAAGRSEETVNHFLDLDAFGPPPFDVPLKEADHLARHGAHAAARGRLPWRIAEIYQGLVESFRARDSRKALEQAAILGHFVADAHVPFHAVLNYDGQLTGQNGLHHRWEVGLPERFARQIEPGLRPPPTRSVQDPVAFSLAILRDSYQAALEATAADRAVAGPQNLAETPEDDRYDEAYFSRLYEKEGGRLRARLEAAASATGSLWQSAWVAAGRPSLPAFRFAYVRRGRRAVLVFFDGAAVTLFNDAIARGVMPCLGRLLREGASAAGSVTSWPSKTAPAHAAIFTGAWSDVNGISGNSVSVPGASILRTESGFASTHLRAEPLWITAARQGLDVSVVSATQGYPFSPFLEGRRFGGNFSRNLTLLDGYRTRDEGSVLTAKDLPRHPAPEWQGELPPHQGAIDEVALPVADTIVFGLLLDDPGDPTQGFDTLLLSPERDTRQGVILKPSPPRRTDPSAFRSLVVRVRSEEAGVFFRLFVLAPDGSDILLYRTGAQPIAASKPRVAAEALAATSGFVGNGAARWYEAGAVGLPAWRGGDGTAEARYLETVTLAVRQMACLADFAFDRTAWDLLFVYFPVPDEPLHRWWGYLDATLPGHDSALAARIRPYLDEVLTLCDAQLARLIERAGPEAIVAVASDHGMVGADRLFRPNLALRRAGLLTLDADGRVDLRSTKAVYSPGNSGWILLNRTSRESGTVPPEAEDEVRRQIVIALRSVVDPTTGAPVVTGILDPRDGHDPSFGGPTGGDLHLVLAPGFDLSAELQGAEVDRHEPKGTHFQDPERLEMQGFFVMAGPGVAAGADLGRIRLIDIAPTLSVLLGIDPPAQSRGRILEKALSRRLP